MKEQPGKSWKGAADRALPFGSRWAEIFRTRDSAPWSTPVSREVSELTVRRGVTTLVEWETAQGWRDLLAPREALEGTGELLV